MAKTITVDWDQVVWDRDTNDFKPGAREGLATLYEAGWVITIYSNNRASWIRQIIEEQSLPPMHVWSGTGKPNCDCYLDDKAVRFYNWEQALWDIETIYGTSTEQEVGTTSE